MRRGLQDPQVEGGGGNDNHPSQQGNGEGARGVPPAHRHITPPEVPGDLPPPVQDAGMRQGRVCRLGRVALQGPLGTRRGSPYMSGRLPQVWGWVQGVGVGGSQGPGRPRSEPAGRRHPQPRAPRSERAADAGRGGRRAAPAHGAGGGHRPLGTKGARSDHTPPCSPPSPGAARAREGGRGARRLAWNGGRGIAAGVGLAARGCRPARARGVLRSLPLRPSGLAVPVVVWLRRSLGAARHPPGSRHEPRRLSFVALTLPREPAQVSTPGGAPYHPA